MMRHDDKDQDQEPELTRFYRLDHSWSFDGQDHVIYVAAYNLLLKGNVDSASPTIPGSFPMSPSAAPARARQSPSRNWSPRYWERVDGGYRIRDWDLLRMVMEHVQMLKKEAARTLGACPRRAGRGTKALRVGRSTTS